MSLNRNCTVCTSFLFSKWLLKWQQLKPFFLVIILGDGLGATNQGIKDPITIKSNSDNRGIGHEVGMDDVWLNQKDDFDDVLASLNSAHASTANSDNEQDQESSKTG